MPTQKQVTERYWSVCWAWIFPYPCRKTRTVTKWCYLFSIWKQTNYLFIARHTACEGDMEYSWWGGGFGTGTIVHIPQEKCFKSKLDGKKGCSLEGIQVPYDGP